MEDAVLVSFIDAMSKVLPYAQDIKQHNEVWNKISEAAKEVELRWKPSS